MPSYNAYNFQFQTLYFTFITHCIPANFTASTYQQVSKQVSKYTYRAPLITSESEALWFAARGY